MPGLVETAFRAGRCPRCAALTLTGRAAGLLWRLDATPIADRVSARILKTFGVSVLRLEARATGVWADFWEPDHHELADGQHYLAAPHVCGSAHSREEHS